MNIQPHRLGPLSPPPLRPIPNHNQSAEESSKIRPDTLPSFRLWPKFETIEFVSVHCIWGSGTALVAMMWLGDAIEVAAYQQIRARPASAESNLDGIKSPWPSNTKTTNLVFSESVQYKIHWDAGGGGTSGSLNSSPLFKRAHHRTAPLLLHSPPFALWPFIPHLGSHITNNIFVSSSLGPPPSAVHTLYAGSTS